MSLNARTQAYQSRVLHQKFKSSFRKLYCKKSIKYLCQLMTTLSVLKCDAFNICFQESDVFWVSSRSTNWCTNSEQVLVLLKYQKTTMNTGIYCVNVNGITLWRPPLLISISQSSSFHTTTSSILLEDRAFLRNSQNQ